MKNLLIVFCLALGIISCEKDRIAEEPTPLLKEEVIVKGDTFISDYYFLGGMTRFELVINLDKDVYSPGEKATYSGYVRLTDYDSDGKIGPKRVWVLDNMDLFINGRKIALFAKNAELYSQTDYAFAGIDGNIGVEIMEGSYDCDISIYANLSDVSKTSVSAWVIKSMYFKVPYKVYDSNKLPVATAGADKTVNEGQSIVFSDAAVSDPEGDPITGYYWVCVDMTKECLPGEYLPSRYFFLAEDTVSGVFSDPKVLNPTFTASNISGDQQYMCILRLTSTHIVGGRIITTYSDNPPSDFLTVTIKDSN